MGRVRATASVLLLSCAPLVRAASPDRITRVVTLEEAIASAQGAPELRAAASGEQAAAAGVRVARALGDPSVAFVTNSVTARGAFAATLPLPWPARGSRISAAEAAAGAAGHFRSSSRASARRDLRIAWFALAAAEDRARAAADREAQMRRNADAIAALYQEGRVARLEAVRAEAEAALARSERASADEARATAAAALAALMGTGDETDVTTGGSRPVPGPDGSLEDCLARARESSPQVGLQRAQVQAAEARVALARSLRLPSFELSAGVDVNDPTNPGTNKWVGLSFNLPLAGPAAASVAGAERDREAALLLRERRDAATAAEAAWRASRAARLRFEAIDGGLRPAAREAAELTRLAYREGKADLFRLLDAERFWSETEVAGAEAYEGWGVAHAELLRITSEEER